MPATNLCNYMRFVPFFNSMFSTFNLLNNYAAGKQL